MRLVNYRCDHCGHEIEELFDSHEEIPEVLPERLCFECRKRGHYEKFNFKNNDQVQKFKGEW